MAGWLGLTGSVHHLYVILARGFAGDYGVSCHAVPTTCLVAGQKLDGDTPIGHFTLG